MEAGSCIKAVVASLQQYAAKPLEAFAVQLERQLDVSFGLTLCQSTKNLNRFKFNILESYFSDHCRFSPLLCNTNLSPRPLLVHSA